MQSVCIVAPLVGAWIETYLLKETRRLCLSRPSWARGLKLQDNEHALMTGNVAPLVGAWIETPLHMRHSIGK